MKATFLLSTLDDFPNLKDSKGKFLPDIALAGRSNVGKSSLINHFFNQKKLAKTSATPGKTQLLNFFIVDEKFLLVDLPGYGYAKAPLEEIEKWSSAIHSYMEKRKTLKLIFLLIDSRREISEDDQLLIDWADSKQIPFLLIFTKTDKLSLFEKNALLKKYPKAIFYTVKDSAPRHFLKKKIETLLPG